MPTADRLKPRLRRILTEAQFSFNATDALRKKRSAHPTHYELYY